MLNEPLPVFKVIGHRDDLENFFLQKSAIFHVMIVETALSTEI